MQSFTNTTVRKKRRHTHFVSPKLVTVLDLCKSSVWKTVYMVQAIAEAYRLQC